MEWTYDECTCVVNKLQYLTPGCGLIQIEFDKDSNPSVRGLDGAPYFSGIPDERALLGEIRKKYPHGFHSRNDVGFEWLADRATELARIGGVKINSFEEYGCIMVDGVNHDAYKVELDHEYIKAPIYIAMTFVRKEFLVFRPYIRIYEFGDEENIRAFRPETEPTRVEPGEIIYFQDEIVSVKSYQYEFDTKRLQDETYCFKNNEHGFMYDTRFGKFMSAGGVTHLK